MRTGIKRRVKEIANRSNENQVFHAFLAEEYDGIGQYIKISLSRHSLSAGVRARISVGDFGTSQTMPVGTPVSVFVYRGLVEIISMGAK